MTRSVNELNSDLFGAEDPVDPALDPKLARKKAMDLLARRDYGRAELVGRLRASGFDVTLAEETVDTLAGEGLQDDARFASSFVQSKLGRGSGPVRIRQALTEKGLRGAVIDEALDEAGADWVSLAREVRLKKFGAEMPADFGDKARQMRFLQYRGFEHDHIRAAVDGAGDDGD